jgi:hypothetical protein
MTRRLARPGALAVFTTLLVSAPGLVAWVHATGGPLA